MFPTLKQLPDAHSIVCKKNTKRQKAMPALSQFYPKNVLLAALRLFAIDLSLGIKITIMKTSIHQLVTGIDQIFEKGNPEVLAGGAIYQNNKSVH